VYDPSEQIRFNTCCGNAALGYASAATAAYGVMAGQVFNFWLAALRPEPSRPVPSPAVRRRARRNTQLNGRSGGKPDLPTGFGPLGELPWLGAAAMMQPFTAQSGYPVAGYGGLMVPGPLGGGFPQPDLAALTNAWWSMDITRPPAAWPMAYGMIASGVHEAVAWPMAEANLAAMDAAMIANRAVERAMGGFRGGGVQPMPSSLFDNPFLNAMSAGGSNRAVSGLWPAPWFLTP